jgi:hypothetical protein
MTNNLLFEAVGMHLFERWGNMHLRVTDGSLESAAEEAALLGMIPVTDQALNNLAYRAGADFNNTSVPNYAYRAAVSYITGSHAFKVGFNRTHGFLEANNYTLSPLRYRFGGSSGTEVGVPNQVTISSRPFKTIANMDNDLGLYVQDRWRMDRLTLTLALRYDYFATSFPEQHLGASQYTPNRNVTFPAEDNLGYKDVTYRTGVTYDVFGNGRTAVKVAFNKYLLGQTLNGLASSVNPINRLQQTASRTWIDNDRDYVVDCNLLNFSAQSPTTTGSVDQCGAVSGAGANFGSINLTSATFDPDVRQGWGRRESNYEVSAGVQHELMPRVSVDVGYFRRIWANFRVTDNLAVGTADFDTFDVTAPRDPRLPNGGGYLLTGLRNIKPTSFSIANRDYTTISDKIVDGGQIERGDYLDVNVNARLRSLAMQFGTSSGRTTTDNCAIRAALPELSVTSPTSRCRQVEPFQTQFKGYAVYDVPVVRVQVSGTFRSTPGSDISANFTMNNAYLAANSTLGRALSGGGNANISVDLLEPNTRFNPRRTEIDLRFGKVLSFGRNRAVVSVDVFNATNSNVVLDQNDTFLLTNPNWPTPEGILNARLVKFSLQYDF